MKKININTCLISVGCTLGGICIAEAFRAGQLDGSVLVAVLCVVWLHICAAKVIVDAFETSVDKPEELDEMEIPAIWRRQAKGGIGDENSRRKTHQ